MDVPTLSTHIHSNLGIDVRIFQKGCVTSNAISTAILYTFEVQARYQDFRYSAKDKIFLLATLFAKRLHIILKLSRNFVTVNVCIGLMLTLDRMVKVTVISQMRNSYSVPNI